MTGMILLTRSAAHTATAAVVVWWSRTAAVGVIVHWSNLLYMEGTAADTSSCSDKKAVVGDSQCPYRRRTSSGAHD
jgi:hypothetical protein